MWWFLQKMQPAPLPVRLPVRVSEHKQSKHSPLDAVPDMSRLNDHGVAVKTWLPKRAAQTMKWLADYEGISQSNWVRAQLTSYVYGQVAVLAQRIRGQQMRVEESHIAFSRGSVDRGAGR